MAEEYIEISRQLANNVGDLLDVDWNKVDLEELRRGIEVEMEHGTMFGPKTDVINGDLVKSAQIALAHIYEVPDYYTRLDKMRSDAEEETEPLKTKGPYAESVKKLIEGEVEQALLEEGFVDFLKSVGRGATEAWDNIKGAFKKAADRFQGFINDKVKDLQNAADKLSWINEVVEEAEQESGQKIETTQALQIAQNLPELAEAAQQEVQQDKEAAAQYVQPQQAESVFQELTDTLNEASNNQPKKKLNEGQLNEVGVTTIIGLILGTIGGIPLLLKALHKLAAKFKFETLAETLQKAYKVVHELEQKTVDWVIPDILSYSLYKKAWNKGFKASKEFLEYEDYKNSKAREKTENLVYKVLLAYFAFHGIAGAMKAGISAVGVAEASATAVKATEIAQGVLDATKIAKM